MLAWLRRGEGTQAQKGNLSPAEKLQGFYELSKVCTAKLYFVE